MKNFIKKHLLWLLAILSIVSIILPFFIEKALLEKFTFTITALAFFAGAMAIILQKEALEEQKIIGAWQLLTNKACGNSGKKEAIEFLASKGVPLSGIDLSAKTHGGTVYLVGLFKDFKGDRSKINLNSANFSGAVLKNANFSEAYLIGANFSEANLSGADFSEANLRNTDFFSNKAYFDSIRSTVLPKAPQGYKFVIDERIDENGKPIYPKGDPIYRFIKLVKI